ncbi:hypothetical protein Pcinc_006594 [Petrolisthes cinctipes]|uniref:Alpha 1,4-glycosyltransferase domain-containing protein n=1 Tax=Petrolisthes cinctipes TaxID=88211 RepID=A0AAE1GB89_PETCI|nr:hypothetical protein Pcinc_006594 [Petrolisthes cinctipes]
MVSVCVVVVVVVMCVSGDSGDRNTPISVPLRGLTKDLGHSEAPRTGDQEREWWADYLCHQTNFQGQEQKHIIPLQQLFRDVTPERRDRNVFLMDTACNTHPRYRAWCSVESWANQNPDLDVWFLMTSQKVSDTDGLPSLLMHKYPNLRLVGTHLAGIFKGTPVEPLYLSRKWTVSETWPPEVLSNMLRALVLWHYGGIYSDTDILSIRPFTLPLNATGFDVEAVVGSALYAFSAHHPLLWTLMEDINKEFIPGVWGIIGPAAVTRVVKKACGTNDTYTLLHKAPVSCANKSVTIYPDTHFFPVFWYGFERYFNKSTGLNFDKDFKSSYVLHMWNKLSKWTPIKMGFFSIYEAAARRSCPLTFSRATLRSNFF